MATDVTNIDLIRDSGVVCTAVAFVADTDNLAETLTFIPTQPCNHLVLIINEVSSGGAMTVDVAAGNYWAALAMTQVSVASGTSKAFVFTSARYQTTTGVDATESKIVVTVTPFTDQKLDTDHAATYMHFQLPV